MKIQLSDHFTFKKFLKFTLPSIFMMVVTSIYGVIDGLFISNFVGETQFAAINFIMPFIMILGGMGFMLGTGGAALVSKTLGESKAEKANEYFSMIVSFTVLFGSVLTVIGMCAVRPVAVFLGATEEMIEPCVVYGRIIIGFTVFFMLQNVFQSFLAAAEKPKLGLTVTLIVGGANALLDALFIVAFQWGIVGAAIATGIGQLLGGLIPLVYFCKRNTSLLRLVKTHPKINLFYSLAATDLPNCSPMLHLP